MRIRAITFEELDDYLELVTNLQGPAPVVGASPGRHHDASFLDGNGRPGGSAMAQYRRRRAADRRTWRATVPQRLAGVLATGVVVALATTFVAGPSLAPVHRPRRRPGPGVATAVPILAATLAWRHGAEGERQTARQLASLERRGYQVFHDLAAPGRPPTSITWSSAYRVFVIDSKRYRGQLRYLGGHLWHGGRTLDRTFETLWWEAAQVAETLGFGPDLHVYPVLCVHLARLPWHRELLVDGVPVLGTAALRPALQVVRQALSPEQVALVAGQVRAGFRPAA